MEKLGLDILDSLITTIDDLENTGDKEIFIKKVKEIAFGFSNKIPELDSSKSDYTFEIKKSDVSIDNKNEFWN